MAPMVLLVGLVKSIGYVSGYTDLVINVHYLMKFYIKRRVEKHVKAVHTAMNDEVYLQTPYGAGWYKFKTWRTIGSEVWVTLEEDFSCAFEYEEMVLVRRLEDVEVKVK